MKKIKFELEEESRANKVYLLIEYFGGDADTEHPVEILLPFTFNKINDNLDYIEKEYEIFRKLKNILDVNHPDFCSSYSETLEKHGEELANLLDGGNVPSDPQSDYDTYCAIDCINLIGYDKEGNKHISYL